MAMCYDLEERIEYLEYILYFDYSLEYHMKRFHKPSEVTDFYNNVKYEYESLLKQQESEME